MIMNWLRSVFKVHSPIKEWPEIEKLEYTDKRIYDIPTNAKYPPNMTRAYLGLDPIIHVGKDKQVIKIFEDKSVIIQFDRLLSEVSVKEIKEDIQKQIKEHGFAVVDSRCKIIEFDNPKAVIETK